MYTEDDKEVKIKKKNSNVEEDDYSNFYGTSDEDREPVYSDGGKKFNYKILLIIILAIILGVLLFILIKGNGSSGDIELSQKEIALEAGEKGYISYKIVGTESDVKSTFTSSNPLVVTVDENGELTAISSGEATIVIKYTIDGRSKEKKCTVKVTGMPKMSLELKASSTNWTNKDVTITVDAKSDAGIASIQYAINCSDKCKYENVKDNKIVITNIGTTKVKVVAKDKTNQEVTKEITTKIDKEAPSITFDNKTTITSNSDVTVCAKCSDSLSGCKNEQVCNKYTSSKSNQVVTVYDNAGNSAKSSTFNVVINRPTIGCSLKVSSSGVVSATLKGTVDYYGFNSNYSGEKTLSQQISINASKDGETSARVVYYYIKDKDGNKSSCHLTVVKECKCKTSGKNCKAECTFRAS